MKRSCLIAAVLVVMCGLAPATQTRASILPVRKGTLQDVWLEPSPPTSSSAVSVHVSVVDPLRVDRLEVEQLSHRYVVRVYWSDPPAGAATNSSLGQCTQSLGTLAPGYYAVLVLSFYKGISVDFESMIFKVY
jgi:hypothetical protein